MSNTTPLSAADYDRKIEDTIPLYRRFFSDTIGIVKAVGAENPAWLDTGCGTGAMTAAAAAEFPNALFTLCDPSDEMLSAAKKRFDGLSIVREYKLCGSQDMDFDCEFDVVTAIQCHHYLDRAQRELAVKKCYDALKEGGIFVTYENYAPNSEYCVEVGKKRWKAYQQSRGKTEAEAAKHISRYNSSYFPITLSEQLDLLTRCGFREAEILSVSFMQAGFYAVK